MSSSVYRTQDTNRGGRPSRRALTEWAVEELRDLIYTGALPPGTPVSEEDLTQRLGISRTPAREALKELEGQGLVEVSAVTGRRMIAQFDTEDIYETYTIRSALEELAASRAAARTTPELVQRLTGLQDEMESNPILRDNPRRRDFEIDFDLHREICAAGALPRLAVVLQPLWAQTHSLLRGVFTVGIYGDAAEDAAAYRDHREIIAAIAAGDPEAAAAGMRKHLSDRRDALITAVQLHTPPDSPPASTTALEAMR